MAKLHRKGFTLIELMIVLAIVAILVTLALPSFIDTLRKSRRVDAMDAILSVQMAEERYRTNNPIYGTLIQIGIVTSGTTYTSPDGHYSLQVMLPLAADEKRIQYRIIATPQGDQTSDPCGNFVLFFDAGVISKTVSGSINVDLCWRK